MHAHSYTHAPKRGYVPGTVPDIGEAEVGRPPASLCSQAGRRYRWEEATTQQEYDEKDRRGPCGNKAGRKAGDPAIELMSRERTSEWRSEKGVGIRGQSSMWWEGEGSWVPGRRNDGVLA